MVKTSVLHDALKNINNAEKAGKRQVMIRPASKVITKFLQVMQRHGTLQTIPRASEETPVPREKIQFGMITGRRSLQPTTLVF